MSDKITKIPKVRFKGKTDHWRQLKLKDVISERNILQEKSEEYPLVSFTVENGVTPKTERYEREQLVTGDKNLKKYKVTELDDIVYNPANLKFGAISLNTYGKAVFSPIYITFVVNQEIALPYYIGLFVTRKDFIQYSLKYQQGTVYERQSVSPENFLSMDLFLPSKEEQRKIKTFFYKIDYLIHLYERELELMKQEKQTFLSKIFPKKGEKFPEARFEGFTDTWEQRKLSEIATMNARIGWQNLRTSEFLNSGDFMLITGTDFENGSIDYSNIHYVEKERYEQDKKIQISNGSILITKDGTLGKVAYVENLSKPATLNAGVFNVRVKNNVMVNEKYLFHYLRAPYLLRFAAEQSTGGTIKHLNQNVLVEFPIPLPNYDEQDKIGTFFSRLDNLITLHQRELDSLKTMKKSLLKEMFV